MPVHTSPRHRKASRNTKQTSRRTAGAAPSRIPRLAAHQHDAGRPEYAPDLLMVKCKEDVVRNVPDIQAAHDIEAALS